MRLHSPRILIHLMHLEVMLPNLMNLEPPPVEGDIGTLYRRFCLGFGFGNIWQHGFPSTNTSSYLPRRRFDSRLRKGGGSGTSPVAPVPSHKTAPPWPFVRHWAGVRPTSSSVMGPGGLLGWPTRQLTDVMWIVKQRGRSVFSRIFPPSTLAHNRISPHFLHFLHDFGTCSPFQPRFNHVLSLALKNYAVRIFPDISTFILTPPTVPCIFLVALRINHIPPTTFSPPISGKLIVKKSYRKNSRWFSRRLFIYLHQSI